MTFDLEVLDAADGDCLMLHYGKAAPHHVLIDAGRRSVWKQRLAPRLAELAHNGDGPALDLVVISHVDDDHIDGIKAMLEDIVKGDSSATIDALWHNSFDADPGTNQLSGVDAGGTAGVAGGKEVRKLAATLDLAVNAPEEVFKDHFVLRYKDEAPRVDFGNEGDALTLTVLSPTVAELNKLQSKWDNAPARDHGGAAGHGGDSSVTNLSSIVLLAEYRGCRALLAGDANAERIIEGIKAAGLHVDRERPLDVLKIPHHGSARNVAEGFFKVLPAKHYVISANGKDDNPDIKTLDFLWEERGDACDHWTLWMTFTRDAYMDVEDTGSAATKRRDALQKVQTWLDDHPKVHVKYRDRSKSGHIIRIA